MFWIFLVLGLYNFSNVKGQNRDFRINNGFDVPLSENVIIGDEIPGIAGIDYPTYSKVPRTSFRCDSQTFPGYYADPESRCQAFYICQRGGKGFGFLCPNGTLFSQEVLVCDWWNNVQCDRARENYDENRKIFNEMNLANQKLGIPTIRTPVRGNDDIFGGNNLDDRFPDQPFGPNQFGGSNQRPSFPGLRPGFGNQNGPSPFGDRFPTGQRPGQDQRPGFNQQGRPTGQFPNFNGPNGNFRPDSNRFPNYNQQGRPGGQFPNFNEQGSNARPDSNRFPNDNQQGRPGGQFPDFNEQGSNARPDSNRFPDFNRPIGPGGDGFPGNQGRPTGPGSGSGSTTPLDEFGRPTQGTSFRPTYGRPGTQDSGFPTTERQPGGFGRPSTTPGYPSTTGEFGRPDTGSGYPSPEGPTGGFGRPSTTPGYPSTTGGYGRPDSSSGYPTPESPTGGYGRPGSNSGYPTPESPTGGYGRPTTGGNRQPNRPTPGYGGPEPSQYPDLPSYNQPDDNLNFNRPQGPGYPSSQNPFGPSSSQTGGRPNTDLEGPGGGDGANFFYEPNKNDRPEQPNDGSSGYNYEKPKNGLDDFNGYQYNKPSRGYLPSF